MNTVVKLKLLVVLLFAVGVAAVLLTDNAANPRARAFSAGPPAGYTRAPGEIEEACAECHTTPAQSAGTISLTGANTFSGGINHNGGVLSINTGGALGSGPLTVSTGVLSAYSGASPCGSDCMGTRGYSFSHSRRSWRKRES